MSFTRRKKTAIIWMSALLMVSCSALIMRTKVSSRAKTLALRNATDTLMLLIELESDSGDGYSVAKAALFEDLLLTYAEHMERRDLHWIFRIPPFSKKNAVDELKLAAEYLREADHTDAFEVIKKASESLAQFLNESKPFTDDPIINFEPEIISEEIQKALKESLKEAHSALEEYAKDKTVASAEKSCMANRKSIVYLYLTRFGHQQIIDREKLKRFRTDLNRTINYNQLLQQTDSVKNGKGKKDSDYDLLDKYSDSEKRRLRLLQAIMINDIQQAQLLLQEGIIKAIPDIQFSNVDN
ncbi:MAG: hypothetical protein ACYTFW_19650 [Planctomycetota bacterium]|jgi:hypothetical protein